MDRHHEMYNLNRERSRRLMKISETHTRNVQDVNIWYERETHLIHSKYKKPIIIKTKWGMLFG